jgi:eukaryotic-like serine/threonine-protein kinase
MAGFTVPGFDVDQRLGRGWGGELWSAHGRATGRPVLLRRLAVRDDVATHDRIRRAAARLVGVQHAHLVALRGVLSVEGAVVLVHDHVPGVALDRLLAERGPLEEAEVVTLLVPLAQALAAVHAAGLVHGRVSPSSVQRSDDGRPMLADTGIAPLIDGRDRSAGSSDDVRDLALTCRIALGPAARAGHLAAVLQAAAADDAGRRPSASELAAAVLAIGAAVPINHISSGSGRVTQPTRPTTARLARRRPHRHRRTSHGSARRAYRRWVGLLVGVGAAVAAALCGLAWAGVDPGASGSSVAAREHQSTYDDAAAAGHWRSVLAALDARRASAFATVSAGQLATVYAAGSPALRRDRARLDDLAAAGLRVDKLRLRPRSVRVVISSSTRVVLDVVDALDSYDVRTARGALVEARPGRGAAAWRVTLVREGSAWRVYDVGARPG